MSNFNSTFDNDFDSFLNLDTADYTSSSISPATKALPSLNHQSSASSSTSTYAAPSQLSFTGPSYQYDSHRQQTPLPSGALANTFAVNQALGLHYRHNQMGFVMPTETLNTRFSNNFDDFDFTRNQSLDMTDMDFDADSPSDVSAMFYAGSNGESSQSAPIQRMYPGIHSQQAAEAKAAQAQKQQELLNLQQQPKQIPGQRPLPTQAPKTNAVKDLHVEESITRLLNRMRQGSAGSAEESSPTNSGMSGLVRPKKEEDDMDEDERLLASEEGKKLSSKERRQLRNKVSARAFRSRRKEYIGQLEGEVAVKVQEANDLRVQNQQLMEENTRLTDLTRMLLSSQAFSGFLQELSNSGLPASNVAALSSISAQSTQARKDVSVHEAARRLQNQPMTTIPETSSDTAGLDASSNKWNSLPSNDFQVYSVTSLPRPMLDMTAFVEKKFSAPRSSAKDIPTLPTLPPRQSEAITVVDEAVVNDSPTAAEDSSDLYDCSVVPATIATPSASQILISSLDKPEPSLSSAPSKAFTETDAWSSLQHMCSELDELSARIESYLP